MYDSIRMLENAQSEALLNIYTGGVCKIVHLQRTLGPDIMDECVRVVDGATV